MVFLEYQEYPRIILLVGESVRNTRFPLGKATCFGTRLPGKVGTQDPENLDEELKPLVTVWSRFTCLVGCSAPYVSLPPPHLAKRRPEGPEVKRDEVGVRCDREAERKERANRLTSGSEAFGRREGGGGE